MPLEKMEYLVKSQIASTIKKSKKSRWNGDSYRA